MIMAARRMMHVNGLMQKISQEILAKSTIQSMASFIAH